MKITFRLSLPWTLGDFAAYEICRLSFFVIDAHAQILTVNRCQPRSELQVPLNLASSWLKTMELRLHRPGVSCVGIDAPEISSLRARRDSQNNLPPVDTCS